MTQAQAEIPLRMRVLWGATLVTAGAQITAPHTAEVPVLVEGASRPIHVPMCLFSGTLDEILGEIRLRLTSAFADAFEAQRQHQMAFVDTSVRGMTDLTPSTKLNTPPALDVVPEPLPPAPTPPAFPEALPAAEIPPATTELAQSSQVPSSPPTSPSS